MRPMARVVLAQANGGGLYMLALWGVIAIDRTDFKQSQLILTTGNIAQARRQKIGQQGGAHRIQICRDGID